MTNHVCPRCGIEGIPFRMEFSPISDRMIITDSELAPIIGYVCPICKFSYWNPTDRAYLKEAEPR